MSKTATYSLIASQTVSTAAGTYTFTSIPQTFTDLIVVINAKASTAINSYVQVGNGTIDTGTNYSRTLIQGNGTSATSGRNSSVGYYYLNDVAGVNSSEFNYVDTVHLMDYANTTTYKTFMNRCNNATLGVGAQVGLWRSTAAIDRVLLGLLSGATWSVGTTFKLYGIQAGSI